MPDHNDKAMRDIALVDVEVTEIENALAEFKREVAGRCPRGRDARAVDEDRRRLAPWAARDTPKSSTVLALRLGDFSAISPFRCNPHRTA
jgi:hypothetical protein